MKKKILLSIVSVTLLMACGRKDHMPMQCPNHDPATTNAADKKAAYSTPSGGPQINAKFIASDRGCDPTNPENCVILWEPVVIRPKLVALMNDAVINGPTRVAQVFSGATVLQSDIPVQLGSNMMQNLQSGTYYIAKASQSANYVTYFVGPSLPLNTSTQHMIFQINL